MFNRLKQSCSVVLLAWSLSACQSVAHDTQTPPATHMTQAKGEWSLVQMTEPNDFDVSQMRYRISLRITNQQFSLAAPCSRLLGQYRSRSTDLRFLHIEQRDIVCANVNEASTLNDLLQRTRSYHMPSDDTMQWLDQNKRVLALWQRIYL